MEHRIMAQDGESAVRRLRPCKALVWRANGQTDEIVGRFHCWGCSYEEFDAGPANYTTAIIELDDGRIVEAAPNNVMFIDKEV